MNQTYCVGPLSGGRRHVLYRYGNYCYVDDLVLSEVKSTMQLPRLLKELQAVQSKMTYVAVFFWVVTRCISFDRSLFCAGVGFAMWCFADPPALPYAPPLLVSHTNASRRIHAPPPPPPPPPCCSYLSEYDHLGDSDEGIQLEKLKLATDFITEELMGSESALEAALEDNSWVDAESGDLYFEFEMRNTYKCHVRAAPAAVLRVVFGWVQCRAVV